MIGRLLSRVAAHFAKVTFWLAGEPDPVMDALKAEHARPRRERRTLAAIEADMRAVTKARLEAAQFQKAVQG